MWTSLICLSLAFTQIYGQGFQLFFGTTQGITECKDKLPNCFAFKKDSCKAPYEKWAHDYCPLYCGFCQGPPTPAPACEDTKSDCDSYQKSVCTDDVYRQWSYDNCRYYCRLCTPAQLALKDSQITTLPPALCVDKLDDCKLYGKDSCTGEYSGWAKENCRRFCGFCVGLPTPAPPCRDVIPNCNRYQKNTCTDIKYKGWAEENCNKFCGFCSDGSSSGNQPSVTSAPTFAPPFPQASGNQPTPSGTMAPPLPGGKRRNLGAGSSASEGNNVFFGTDKPKATPKPTPAPTTTTLAPTTTTQAPTTTTPQPTTTTEAPTTPKPKPKDNALSIGSSAGGQKNPNVIDFGNNSELTTTEAPEATTKGDTGTGTGSSAGGATTAPPDNQSTEPPTQAPVKTQPPTQAPVKTQPPTKAPVKTQPPTKAPVKTQPPTQPPPTKEIPTQPPTNAPVKTQPPTKAPVKTQPPTNAPVKTQPPTKAPVKTQPPTKAPVTTQAPPATTQGPTAAATNATGNNTDSGTGSQPNNSKPPMSGTTSSPAGTTSGSGMVGSTAGSGSVSTAGTGAATGSNNGTKNGTSAGTGSGPNSGTTMKVPPTPLASSTMKGPTKPQTTQAPAPTNPPSSKAPVTSAPVKTNPSQTNPPAPTKPVTTPMPGTLTPPTNTVTYPNINVTDKYSNTDANNTNTECKDLINCRAYPPEKICVNDSVYKPWASVRCRAYCGYCIPGGDNITCDHNGQLIRHPKDCHKFYECAYSIPRELTCPSSLAWNDVIKTCDYVGNVPFCKQLESNNDSSDKTIQDLTENTSPVPCVDKIPNCNEYDADLCTNPLYRLFREDNCLKFCNLCKGGSPTAPSPGKRDYEKEDETIEFY